MENINTLIKYKYMQIYDISNIVVGNMFILVDIGRDMTFHCIRVVVFMVTTRAV